MLQDLINELIDAIDSGDKKRREKVFNNLQWLGIDRTTALVLAENARKESAQ